MATIFYILALALSLYVYVLLARVVLDLVQVFSREWKPSGFLLVLAEIVYTLTDPPLRLLRKVIPPLRLGQISLDLGFIVLLIGIQILASFLRSLAYGVA
ncbi:MULTISPECIES: YggT family protein [Brevibacterium]|uniref:YggT family protein n=2 Tax=Brevibacterium TaxID=1696 RepID=A0A1H1WZN0_BRESA|nr:YggT family protein [Brevibacterium sandarakinum]MDN5636045.1 YggT family protein [Brevibacterium sp.]MDN5656046.1 YggT family protein [Brevibacterium sandarakinum]SDT02412.1 YggT family protein [Brevibacterium sandarakinum]